MKAKKKLGFVDGTIEKPEEDDPNYEHWEAWNSMLIAWIFNTMGKDLQATVAYADDVRKLWNDLKERYSQGNLARIYQLKSDICLLKQEGQSVAEYWGKMKGLWDELESYYDNSGCTCGANGAALMKWETEKSFQFIMGLHPEFNTVRSTILSAEPMPGLNKIYSLITHEEKQKFVSRKKESSTEPVAFLAKGIEGLQAGAIMPTRMPRKRQFMAEGRPICDHCGKPGHFKRDCWSINGYPDDWDKGRRSGPKPVGKNYGSNGPRPKYQGRPTHQTQANAVHMGTASSGSSENDGRPIQQIPGLTEAQVQKLFRMLGREEMDADRLTGNNNNNFVAVETEWILDTGASRHITGRREYFVESSPIVGKMPVFIPNGSTVNATLIGKVAVVDAFMLSNVLLVPTFDCNLISIAQLSADINCTITFCSDLCLIQDRTSRRMLGVGEHKGGIYYLRYVATNSAVCRVVRDISEDLWHKRLGHPSRRVKFPGINLHLLEKNKGECDVCIRAKQTRLEFHLSSNKADFPFHHVHCDLWAS